MKVILRSFENKVSNAILNLDASERAIIDNSFFKNSDEIVKSIYETKQENLLIHKSIVGELSECIDNEFHVDVDVDYLLNLITDKKIDLDVNEKEIASNKKELLVFLKVGL